MKIAFFKYITIVSFIMAVFAGSAIAAPQLLVFKHMEKISHTTVYSEIPIDRAAMLSILAKADQRVQSSPLYAGPVGTRIFMTNGGWRWRLLSLNNTAAVGMTRLSSDLVSDAVLINNPDLKADSVSNGRKIGGMRSLSGVIAHERTHIMVRKFLGPLANFMLPQWKAEGYADYVAGDGSLTGEQVAQLRREGKWDPAIPYYDGRVRVAKILASNGNDVAALLKAD